MPNTPSPIICALDTVEVPQAQALSQALTPHIGAIKLGLEFFTANGPQGVRTLSESGAPIFLDLKFHDIPNTVAGAVAAATRLSPFMMTVHTAGGSAMLRAAAEAATDAAEKAGIARPLVVGVTVLTSLDQSDLDRIGIERPLNEQVLRLAELAQSSGLDGIVCSPHEIAALRKNCGKNFSLVVPGIRPAGSASGDQKRVMAPAEALSAGADFLVIGRPITQAASPSAAAQAIAQSLA